MARGRVLGKPGTRGVCRSELERPVALPQKARIVPKRVPSGELVTTKSENATYVTCRRSTVRPESIREAGNYRHLGLLAYGFELKTGAARQRGPPRGGRPPLRRKLARSRSFSRLAVAAEGSPSRPMLRRLGARHPSVRAGSPARAARRKSRVVVGERRPRSMWRSIAPAAGESGARA